MSRIIVTGLLVSASLLISLKANAEALLIRSCGRDQLRIDFAADPSSKALMLQVAIGPINDVVADHLMALPKQKMIVGIINKYSKHSGNNFKAGNRVTIKVVDAERKLVDLFVHKRDAPETAEPEVSWKNLKCSAIQALM